MVVVAALLLFVPRMLAFTNAPPPLTPGLSYGSQYYAVVQEGYVYNIGGTDATARCALLSHDASATVEPKAYALIDMTRCRQTRATVLSCTYVSDEATVADFAAWVESFPIPYAADQEVLSCTEPMQLAYVGRVTQGANPSPPSPPAPPLHPQLAYGSGYYAITQEIWTFMPSEDTVLSRCEALWPETEARKLTITIEDASQALLDSPTCTSRTVARVATCTYIGSQTEIAEFAETGFAQYKAWLPVRTEPPYLCALMELVDWGRSMVAAAKPRHVGELDDVVLQQIHA